MSYRSWKDGGVREFDVLLRVMKPRCSAVRRARRLHQPLKALIATAVPFIATTAFAQTGTPGIGILPGGTYSQAFGISADGTVVSGESSSSSFPFVQAFRWTA